MRPYALIRSHDGKEEERINYADLYNTWSRQFSLSQTYQVDFTMRHIPGFERVYDIAQVQAEVIFGGQTYKIKEANPTLSEKGTAIKKITAQNSLLDKLKNLRVAEQDQDNTSSSDTGSGNDQPGTHRAQTEQTYPLDTVMHQFFDNNDQGVNYELHGNFKPVTEKANGSCLDFLTSNLALSGGYWIPDGNTLKIYDLPSLAHKTGETFRYLYDTTNVDLQQSTADLVNQVDVKAGKMEVTTGSDSGNVSQNASGLIAYAKSWLGRPYISGGRTEDGSDCAGFVHFCYAKMGINIGWTTYTQVGSFHEVSQAQTGDVGFYGSRNAPYHICLFLDANTIIFEPQPGQVCKREPVSWFRPDWIGRNDQMAALINGNGGGDDSGGSTSTQEYYALNFTYKDQDSINQYDVHKGEPQTLDAIYDRGQAEQYLKATLQSQPAISMTWTHKGACPYSLGDSIFTIAPEMNIKTDMIIFGFTTNDFNSTSDSSINFNSTGQAMNDINAALKQRFKNINSQVAGIASASSVADNGVRHEDHFSGMTVVNSTEMAKAKKLTETGAV